MTARHLSPELVELALASFSSVQRLGDVGGNRGIPPAPLAVRESSAPPEFFGRALDGGGIGLT